MVSVDQSGAQQIISRETAELVELDDKLTILVDVSTAGIRLIEGERQELLEMNNPQGIPIAAGDTFPIASTDGQAVYAIGDGGTATVESIVTKIQVGDIAR